MDLDSVRKACMGCLLQMGLNIFKCYTKPGMEITNVFVLNSGVEGTKSFVCVINTITYFSL